LKGIHSTAAEVLLFAQQKSKAVAKKNSKLQNLSQQKSSKKLGPAAKLFCGS